MKRLALVAGIVLALFAGTHYAWIYVERGKYERRVEELREAGEPTRVEDFARPPIPDEENAAVALRKAHEWLERYGEVNARGQELAECFETGIYLEEDGTEDWTRKEWDELRAYFVGLEPYFELLREAAVRPAWHFPYDWSKGPLMISIGPFPWLQEATYQLISKTRLGDTDTAVDATTLLLDLADRYEGPFVLGYLVRLTVRSRVADVLRHAQKANGFDASRFRELVDDRLVEAIPRSGPPAQPFRSERVCLVWIVEQWTSGKSLIDDDHEQTSLLRRPHVYRDARRALDLYDRAVAACEAEPREALAIGRRLQEEPKLRHASLLVSFLGKVFKQYAQEVAVQRLVRVAMALLEHRQKTGAWPARLPDGLPLDPFTGESFVYERAGDAARVRALEPDQDWKEAEDDDLAWSWGWPEGA